MNKRNELDKELMLALEASLAGSGVKPRWVFNHIIATVRKYAAQQSTQPAGGTGATNGDAYDRNGMNER